VCSKIRGFCCIEKRASHVSQRESQQQRGSKIYIGMEKSMLRATDSKTQNTGVVKRTEEGQIRRQEGIVGKLTEIVPNSFIYVDHIRNVHQEGGPNGKIEKHTGGRGKIFKSTNFWRGRIWIRKSDMIAAEVGGSGL